MKRLLFFILLIGMVFATSDYAEIYVTDSKGRPIEGASVVFQCEKKSSGKYITHTEDPVVTDSNGIARTGYISSDCEYIRPFTGTATFQGKSKSAFDEWRAGKNLLSIIIPGLHDLTVTVKDQEFDPILGVEITGVPKKGNVNPVSGTTDKNGVAVFKQVPANTDFILRMKNGNQERSYDATVGEEDSDFGVIMSTCKLIVKVVNENNYSIIGATVNVSRGAYFSSSVTDLRGKTEISGLSPATYNVVLANDGFATSFDVEVEGDSVETFVLDVHGPEIYDVHVDSESSSDPAYVYADVSDRNSGVKSVQMFYTLNGKSWSEVGVTLTGSGLYMGTIPPQPKDTRVGYKVVATDGQGNKSENEGTYTVSDGICPVGGLLILLPVIAFIARKD